MKKVFPLVTILLGLIFVGAGCATDLGSRPTSGAGMAFPDNWFKPGMWATRRTSFYYNNYQPNNVPALSVKDQTLTAAQFTLNGKTYDAMIVASKDSGDGPVGTEVMFWPQGTWIQGQTPKFKFAAEFNSAGNSAPPDIICKTTEPFIIDDMNPNKFPGPLMNDLGNETITLSTGRNLTARHSQSTASRNKNYWLSLDTPFFLTKLVAEDFANKEMGSSLIEVVDQGSSGGSGRFDFTKLSGGQGCKGL